MLFIVQYSEFETIKKRGLNFVYAFRGIGDNLTHIYE